MWYVLQHSNGKRGVKLRKSISHKEICERYVNKTLKAKSLNKNKREFRVDYAIIKNNQMICIEAEALTTSESERTSDLHIIGHLMTLALQNHKSVKITELHWLIEHSRRIKFEKKANNIETKLKELIKNELFPKQIFYSISQNEIDCATRKRNRFEQ